MVKVKVCGITSYEDAAMAIDMGVDALGFNFYNKSPRYIAPADAREIADKLPPFTSLVGLFVNELNLDVVRSVADMVKLTIIQLHGNEGPNYCSQLHPWRLIKAMRVGDNFDVSHVKDFPVSAILLDNYSADAYGGTGHLFDWGVAVQAKQYAKRIILAGGLTPENIVSAIRIVKPYGLDVCSGVESAPGRKDRVRLQNFMQEVQRGRQEIMKSTSGYQMRFTTDPQRFPTEG
jgi:phosphoribosylanthranilate isomerase